MKDLKVNRKIERWLMMIAGIWQVINGVLTIFIYGPYYRREGLELIDGRATIIEAEAISAIFGHLYMFIAIFGMIYIIIGVLSMYLSRKMFDHVVMYKIPVYLLIVGAAAYFVMDVITVFLYLAAGSLALAKNKAIKTEV